MRNVYIVGKVVWIWFQRQWVLFICKQQQQIHTLRFNGHFPT